MFNKILVAYDEGQVAAKALETAIDLAKLVSAEIYIASAYLNDDNPSRFDFLVKIQSEAAARVAGQGITAHRRMEAGARSLGKVIAKIAADTGADIVVMGTNNRGAVGRFMFGSVSEYLLRNLSCPALVVK
ncbi:MAG: universal stress protein [Syntrophomonadaceae bacterium]